MNKSSMIYIGKLIMDGDYFRYIKPDGVKRKDLKALGDIVYFMYVDDVLMKIGKAGKKGGWDGRVGTYKQGRSKNGDRTNKLIHKVMTEMNKDTIEIYCIRTPREIKEIKIEGQEDTFIAELPTNCNVEQYYTQKCKEMGHPLPFCVQLN